MKKILMSFAEAVLSREQMRDLKGGYINMPASGGICPPAGTQFFYTDSEVCGIFTLGQNAQGVTQCQGDLNVTAYQPCGFA